MLFAGLMLVFTFAFATWLCGLCKLLFGCLFWFVMWLRLVVCDLVLYLLIVTLDILVCFLVVLR